MSDWSQNLPWITMFRSTTYCDISLSPTNASKSKCMEVTRQPCWPSRGGLQVPHQRWIWRIHHMQAMKHVSKGIHLNLETDITRCWKQEYQWPQKRTDVLQIYFEKGTMFSIILAEHYDNIIESLTSEHHEGNIVILLTKRNICFHIVCPGLNPVLSTI